MPAHKQARQIWRTVRHVDYLDMKHCATWLFGQNPTKPQIRATILASTVRE